MNSHSGENAHNIQIHTGNTFLETEKDAHKFTTILDFPTK